MSNQFTTFIGVEVSADRTRPFTYAAIDEDLAIHALGHGKLQDAYAFLAGQSNALAAINSPRSTNKGLVKREEIRKRLSANSYLGKWANLRLVELELLERGVNVPRTPNSKKSSPRWMKLGFFLFEELDKLGKNEIGNNFNQDNKAPYAQNNKLSNTYFKNLNNYANFNYYSNNIKETKRTSYCPRCGM